VLNCVKAIVDYEMKDSILIRDLGMKSTGSNGGGPTMKDYFSVNELTEHFGVNPVNP
jgi:hypothetical protein